MKQKVTAFLGSMFLALSLFVAANGNLIAQADGGCTFSADPARLVIDRTGKAFIYGTGYAQCTHKMASVHLKVALMMDGVVVASDALTRNDTSGFALSVWFPVYAANITHDFHIKADGNWVHPPDNTKKYGAAFIGQCLLDQRLVYR